MLAQITSLRQDVFIYYELDLRGKDSEKPAELVQDMEYMDFSPLPAPEKSWALVTGAATGLGMKLARASARAGYGLILTDQAASLPRLESDLEELQSFTSFGVMTICIEHLTMVGRSKTTRHLESI